MNNFDFTTINEFDNHINHSIKGYDVLHSLIVTMSSFFLKKNSTVIDLGCTSGRLLSTIKQTYSNIDMVCKGYDITDANFISIEGIELIKQDITDYAFVIPECEIVYSIFTLQFLPMNMRPMVLSKIYHSMKQNGALFICEKEICRDGRGQEVFTFSNYDYKSKNFTSAEILTKEQGLRAVMNPLPVGQNIDLLKRAGFSSIEPFFQSLNFRGYLCLK